MTKHILSISCLSLFLLSACANQGLTNSGHIQNIDRLEEVKTSKVEKHKKIEEFVVADASQRVFENLAIGPIRYQLPPDADKELNPKDRAKLTKYFDKTLREKLKEFPLIEPQNGLVPPKTYYVDIVVTDINGSVAWLNILLTATVALPFDTGGITVETVIRDLDTNEEVAAFRGFREGTMFHLLGGATEYGHAEGGIQLYADQIKKLLKNFQCVGCRVQPTAEETDVNQYN